MNNTFVPGPFCRYQPDLAIEEIRNFVFNKRLCSGAFIFEANQTGSTVQHLVDTAVQEGLEWIFVTETNTLTAMPNDNIMKALTSALQLDCPTSLMRYENGV